MVKSKVWYRHKAGFVGMIILIVFLLLAAFPSFFSPYEPFRANFMNRLQEPSREHWLGTDQHGRDILSRLIWGGRISLAVGLSSALLGGIIGVITGLFAGFYGGWIDSVLMRLVDLMLAFPAFLRAIALVAIMGPHFFSLVLAIGSVSIPEFARIIRSTVLSIIEVDYVESSYAIGANNMRVIFKHILPNCLAPLLVQLTLSVSKSILAESGLSFLGLGVQPPTASWGRMVASGRDYLLSNPFQAIIPGIAILLLVLAINNFGDMLRDVLDPKMWF